MMHLQNAVWLGRLQCYGKNLCSIRVHNEYQLLGKKGSFFAFWDLARLCGLIVDMVLIQTQTKVEEMSLHRKQNSCLRVPGTLGRHHGEMSGD